MSTSSMPSSADKSNSSAAKMNNNCNTKKYNKAASAQTSANTYNQLLDSSSLTVSNSSSAPIWTTSTTTAAPSISNSYGSISTATSLGSGLFISGLSTSDVSDSFLRLFVLSHEEDEIISALSKVKEICLTYEDDMRTWENIVLAVLKVKHFSEDFIVNYLDEVSNKDVLKDAILVHHAGDVYSRKYATLALKILIDK